MADAENVAAGQRGLHSVAGRIHEQPVVNPCVQDLVQPVARRQLSGQIQRVVGHLAQQDDQVGHGGDVGDNVGQRCKGAAVAAAAVVQNPQHWPKCAAEPGLVRLQQQRGQQQVSGNGHGPRTPAGHECIIVVNLCRTQRAAAYLGYHAADDARAAHIQRVAQNALCPAEQHRGFRALKVDFGVIFLVKVFARGIGRPGGFLRDQCDQVGGAGDRLLGGRHGQQRLQRTAAGLLNASPAVGIAQTLGQEHVWERTVQRLRGLAFSLNRAHSRHPGQQNGVRPESGHQRGKALGKHGRRSFLKWFSPEFIRNSGRARRR